MKPSMISFSLQMRPFCATVRSSMPNTEIPTNIKIAMDQQKAMRRALDASGVGGSTKLTTRFGKLTTVESNEEETVVRIGTGQRTLKIIFLPRVPLQRSPASH